MFKPYILVNVLALKKDDTRASSNHTKYACPSFEQHNIGCNSHIQYMRDALHT